MFKKCQIFSGPAFLTVGMPARFNSVLPFRSTVFQSGDAEFNYLSH